jgi:predicted nucleic acid-binding protein
MASLQNPESRLVLDGWLVMEWLKERPRTTQLFLELLEKVEASKVELYMSEITAGEIYYLTAKDWGIPRAEEMLGLFEAWSVQTLNASRDRILGAARLKAVHAISYADAFVAALGLELDFPVITGDPDFLMLEAATGLRVHWVGA